MSDHAREIEDLRAQLVAARLAHKQTETDLAQAQAQLQWIGECIEGLDVSHFAESFPLIRAVADLRVAKQGAERQLKHLQTQMAGTPARRLDWFLDELEKFYPDPEPTSAQAYEGRFLRWLAAAESRLTEAEWELAGKATRLAAADARAEEARTQYQQESRIVDEVWAALNISTYEQANGKHIAQLVKDLREDLAEATRTHQALVTALDRLITLWDNRGPSLDLESDASLAVEKAIDACVLDLRAALTAASPVEQEPVK